MTTNVRKDRYEELKANTPNAPSGDSGVSKSKIPLAGKMIDSHEDDLRDGDNVKTALGDGAMVGYGAAGAGGAIRVGEAVTGSSSALGEAAGHAAVPLAVGATALKVAHAAKNHDTNEGVSAVTGLGAGLAAGYEGAILGGAVAGPVGAVVCGVGGALVGDLGTQAVTAKALGGTKADKERKSHSAHYAEMKKENCIISSQAHTKHNNKAYSSRAASCSGPS